MTHKDTTEQELERIKRKATDMFHNDHADGDTAIYMVIREVKALLHQERVRGAIEERKEVVKELNKEVVEIRKYEALTTESLYGYNCAINDINISIKELELRGEKI